jgi:uncharacterized protein YcfJ
MRYKITKVKNKMIKPFVVFATIATIFAASTASADQVGYITHVQPVYKIEYQTVNEPVCNQVNTPVYRNVQPGGGDVIAGAIIGGAIGNQFGGGSGKDAMTALGAILGAEAASKPRTRVVEYYSETVCTNNHYTKEVKVFDGYEVHYEVNGKIKSIHTYERFITGERVIVR